MIGTERDAARGRFFAIIADIVPEAIEELAGEPARLARIPEETSVRLRKLFEDPNASLRDVLEFRVEPPGWLFEKPEDAKKVHELRDKLLVEGLLDTVPEAVELMATLAKREEFEEFLGIFVSFLIAREAGILAASKLLRHSGIGITAKAYAPLGVEELRAVANTVAEGKGTVLRMQRKRG